MREANKLESENKFVNGALGAVFFKTAAPIIFMMLVNGSFSLVDAYFLGTFVGADALVAVTSMFPIFIFLIALSTLVSSGFSSVMARLLGADEHTKAKEAFAQAVCLSLLVAAALIALYFLLGTSLIVALNDGNIKLAKMSYVYVSIMVFGAPLMFLLTINSDALRCEGHISMMAIVSLSSVLLNGVFNYVLIVHFSMGVAGSALGTILAQLCSTMLIVTFRRSRNAAENSGSQRPRLVIQFLRFSSSRSYWGEYLSIGAPAGLTHLGFALSSGAIFYNLQIWGSGHYEDTVGAYGILTRLMTFIYLPILGLSLGFQTIVGNNLGAKQYARVNTSIKIALVAAFVYCLLWQLLIYIYPHLIGGIFVDDAGIIAEVSRISPAATLSLWILGPALVVTMYFQAIGDAKRAAILSIAKTYVFLLPLLFILPFGYSEWGVWYAGPVAEVLSLLLTMAVLYHRQRVTGYRLGLFKVI